MCCDAAVRSDRNDHDAAFGELLDQRLRHVLGRRGDDDAVERRLVRRAQHAIADNHLDIVVAERLQPRARDLAERAVALDR